MGRYERECKTCMHFLPETETSEGECLVDEDITSEERCETYERMEEI
jgi:hypothetical protein